MSGKGDNPRPLSVTPEQFAERFDAIDWNAREREKGCPLCGSTAIHACTGQPIAPWTAADKRRVREVMDEIIRQEHEETP